MRKQSSRKKRKPLSQNIYVPGSYRYECRWLAPIFAIKNTLEGDGLLFRELSEKWNWTCWTKLAASDVDDIGGFRGFGDDERLPWESAILSRKFKLYYCQKYSDNKKQRKSRGFLTAQGPETIGSRRRRNFRSYRYYSEQKAFSSGGKAVLLQSIRTLCFIWDCFKKSGGFNVVTIMVVKM